MSSALPILFPLSPANKRKILLAAQKHREKTAPWATECVDPDLIAEKILEQSCPAGYEHFFTEHVVPCCRRVGAAAAAAACPKVSDYTYSSIFSARIASATCSTSCAPPISRVGTASFARPCFAPTIRNGFVGDNFPASAWITLRYGATWNRTFRARIQTTCTSASRYIHHQLAAGTRQSSNRFWTCATCPQTLQSQSQTLWSSLHHRKRTFYESWCRICFLQWRLGRLF